MGSILLASPELEIRHLRSGLKRIICFRIKKEELRIIETLLLDFFPLFLVFNTLDMRFFIKLLKAKTNMYFANKGKIKNALVELSLELVC